MRSNGLRKVFLNLLQYKKEELKELLKLLVLLYLESK